MSKFKYIILLVVVLLACSKVMGQGIAEISPRERINTALTSNNTVEARAILVELGDGTNNISARYLSSLRNITRIEDPKEVVPLLRTFKDKDISISVRAWLIYTIVKEGLKEERKDLIEVTELINSGLVNQAGIDIPTFRKIVSYLKQSMDTEEYKDTLEKTLYYIDADSTKPNLVEVIGFIKSELEKFN